MCQPVTNSLLPTKERPPITVLIADDSVEDFELCVFALSEAFLPRAVHVDSAETFTRALQQEEWDVVLCDYFMPQFTAMDALHILRAAKKNIPFIVVSGSLSEEDAVTCIKAGADDYLFKDRLKRLPIAVEREMREARSREEQWRQETLNQELFQELRDFRAALNASTLVSITDLRGTILEVNEMFCSVSGYSAEELIGSNHNIVSSGYHTKEFWQTFWSVIQSGTIWRGEIQDRTKKGEIYWVDTTVYPLHSADGTMYRYMSLRHVITEKKQAEIQLRESEERFRTLADTAPMLIWMVGTDGNCAYVNKTLVDFTGVSLDEHLGDGWLQTAHPDDTMRIWKIAQEAFARCEPFAYEFRLRHHSGLYRWVEANGVPRYLPNSTFAGYIGCCVDITERKEAEAVLLETNEELERRVKDRTEALLRLNKEKNEFLGIAAHDLKNPLAGIRSTAEIIQYYTNANEKTVGFAKRIVESADRMVEIITNLLDVNRIETEGYHLAFEPTQLTLIHTIAQQYQERAAQKGIILHFDVEAAVEAVYADPQALYQVVENLVSNAVKYSPEWKQIWLRVRDAKTDNGTAVVRIEVQDEGPGFTVQDKERLFTKFARLSAKPTGNESSTGLGLAIVKRLVEEMHGKVWCESEHGGGALFVVELLSVTQ